MKLQLYILDADPALCAAMLCDKHLAEVHETCCELLSNAVEENNADVTKHVLSKWLKNNEAHRWVVWHYFAVKAEILHRFNMQRIDPTWVHSVAYSLNGKVPQPKRWVQLVKPRISGNAVKAYRDYYTRTQQKSSWTRRGVPSWWQGSEQIPLLVNSY